MKTSKYLSYIVLSTFVLALVSCEPRALTDKDVFTDESSLDQILAEENPVHGYKIYTLNEFLDAFMTEAGSYVSDTTPYRERSHDAVHDLYMYSVDTIKEDTLGIYIRGRICTDDYAGNFYKAMVIQQVVNGEQQNLRISADLGSSSYNNNIYAMNASQKVGWCPGRINETRFIRATRMLGAPDVSKLKYDTVTLETLYSQIDLKPAATAEGMDKVRKADGRLVVIRDVHFTGQFDDNGTLAKCDTLHPDSSSNANVFAPTTNNIGYPQSRVLQDQGSKKIMCSCSEYAKFAYYYLPGADRHGVANCANYEGDVTGILGWYLDKASDLAQDKLDGYEWSVTPRGIPGIGVNDIKMYWQGDFDEPWVPKEFNPNDYQ